VAEAITEKQSGRYWFLLPRFEEKLTEDFFRLSGRLRVVVNLCLLGLNIASYPMIGSLQIDEVVFARVFAFHTPMHILDCLLGLWIWKGRASLRQMRITTYLCLHIEMLTILVVLYAYGSVSSHMLIIAVVMLLTYRLAYDFWIGLCALALLVFGHWAIVIAEVSGAIPPQPLARGAVDTVYQLPSRELGSMAFISLMMLLTFAIAHWAVARLRYRDAAIQLLRESLYASDRKRVGRHTGRTLGDAYVLGELLGTGGMGEVYRADLWRGTHRSEKGSLAIKLLHPHLIDDPSVLERFRREAAITGELGSEHIVEVIDVGEDGDQPYLVLEYLDGESLGERLRGGGPIAPAELAPLARQLAAGLEAAHDSGVTHRDLKPENIFLVDTGGAPLLKILDFGVSKIRGRATTLTRQLALVGTPDYMSPEQAVGISKHIDRRTDIFSFGAVLYTAVTGVRPFSAPSVPALLRRICENEPVPASELAGVSTQIDAVLAIAMAKDPAQRYGSATELARDFARAATAELDAEVIERAAAIRRGAPTRIAVPMGNLADLSTLAPVE
jgi:tRNA A-37 threonylcarbamoyl transferase component Bud32